MLKIRVLRMPGDLVTFSSKCSKDDHEQWGWEWRWVGGVRPPQMSKI